MHKIFADRTLQIVARFVLIIALVSGTLLQSGQGAAALTPLRILYSSPSSGTVDVPATGFISLTFDRPMVTLGDVGVAGAHAPATISPAAPGQGRWINTSIWTYQVPGGLALATHYRVTTKPGVTALDGAQLPHSYAFSFDTLRPAVLSAVPAAGTAYVLPGDEVQVVFNQPVQHASAQAAFALRANGAKVPGRFTWNGPLLATQPNGSDAAVPAQANYNGPTPPPPPAKDTVMTFRPARALALGAQVAVAEGPDVRSTAGPLAMEAAYRWQYTVTGPLTVSSTIPSSGETDVNPNKGIEIVFAAPIDQQRISSAVRVSPKVDNLNVYADDAGTTVNVYADFLPSVTYAVSIEPTGLGTARQSLPRRYTLTFTTQPAPSSVSLVSQGSIAAYDAYLGANLYARVVNLSSVTLNAFRLSADQFAYYESNPPPDWQGEPPDGVQPLVTWQVASQAPLNQSILVRQPMVAGGQPLPPGYYLVDAWAPLNGVTPMDHLLVLITRTSVTLKVGQHQVFVWATDLKSGRPVGGESVRVIDEKGQVWARGTTRNDGVFQATVQGLPSDDSLLYHNLMAELTHRTDVAACSLYWNDGDSPYDFNLPYTPYLQPVRMYLTTERPIYRPGQTLYFKGIARQDNDGQYSMPASGTPLNITISDPNNLAIYKATVRLDKFGGFSGKLVLGANASLGTYDIDAKLGVSVVDSGFQVAAYQTPTYAVTVISDRGENANYVQGETVGVQVRANYYFGAPLANAPVAWDLTENDFLFSSTLFPDYSFGDNDWVDSTGQSSGGQQVTQGTGTTDGNGDFHFSVPGNVKASPVSQQFTLEAVLTGPDNQQVAQHTDVVVHKSAVYVGIKPADYVLTAGKPNAVKLVTVADDDSRAAGGVPITVKLYERKWLSSYVRDSSGFYYWQSSHVDTLVARYSVRSNSAGMATVLLTPKDGGEYVVEATALDGAGRPSTSKLSLWVASASEAFVPWQAQNNDRIRLVADKTSYKPGNVAHILVTAPLAGMTALVTVERGGVLSHWILTLPTNSSSISVPIAGLYAPDVYVSVTLVKGPGSDTSLPVWKLGYITLPVDVSARSLHITIKASTPKAKPGQQVTFTVHTANAAGHPVQAQLALSLVDKAVLALAASTNLDVMDTFYQERDLGVESAGSLTQYIDRLNLQQQVGSKGGGGGGGGPGNGGPTRAKFLDTAYWNPSIVTNANGDASVTIALPDNLTTWTFSAVGGTSSTLVGENSMDLIASKDLLLESALPRFLTLDDSTNGGAVVDNLTGAARTVAVTLHVTTRGSLAGVAVPAKDYTSTVTVPAGGSKLVQWPVQADAVGTQTFLFTAQAIGDPSLGDSLQVSLPVEANSILDTSAASGLLSTKVTQTVDIAPGTVPDEGDLTVTLSPSLVSGIGGAASFLANYPYECSEQTTSRIVGLAEAVRLPRSVSGVGAGLAASVPLAVSSGLQQLYGYQNSDGGWGWWPEDLSDPYASAWVLDGLLTLKGLGYTVANSVLSHAVAYVQRWATTLNSDGSYFFTYIPSSTYTYDLQAYVTYLLGRAGSPDPGLASDLYTHYQNMLPFARAYLAQAIAQISGTSDGRVKALLGSIDGAAQQFDNQGHWSDASPDWFMMEGADSATSTILDALTQLDPSNPLNMAAVRWLKAQQLDGSWDSTQSTALAIRALVDYSMQNKPAGGTTKFSIQVNGKTIGAGTISDANRGTDQTFTVPLAALSGLTSVPVTLQRAGGSGQIAYSITLHTYQPVTTVPPVEHGIVVNRRYEPIGGGHGQAGSDLRVVLTITAPEDLYYLQIEDPLPAGAEPVDPTLQTTSVLSSITSLTTIPQGTTDLSWYISHVDLRDDRAALFADYLPAGTYQYSYQIHLTTAGTYHALPTQAKMLYFPDVSGHSSGRLYTIATH